MAQTPYLGSKISLISKLDIRYEGILYTVDSNESTIALAKVRSFGTEDRNPEHPVRARDEIYEFIIFKASDIKDLVVCEAPREPEPEPTGLDYDPAIVSVSQAPVPAIQQQQKKPKTPVESESVESPPAPQGQQRNRPARNEPRPQYFNKAPNYRYPQPPNYYPNYRNGPQRFNRTQTPKEKLKFDTDYDFEKANEKFKQQIDVVSDDLKNMVVFDADEEEKKESGEGEVDNSPAEPVCYDKSSSFFDSISCESSEKAEGRSKRPDWRKERMTNQETFGQQAVRTQYNRQQGGYRPGGFNRGPPRYNNAGPRQGQPLGGYRGGPQRRPNQPDQNQNRRN